MNSVAFVMMLGTFAVVAWWYILNAEKQQDGSAGILRLKETSEEPSKPGMAPDAGDRERIRAALSEADATDDVTTGRPRKTGYRRKSSADRTG